MSCSRLVSSGRWLQQQLARSAAQGNRGMATAESTPAAGGKAGKTPLPPPGMTPEPLAYEVKPLQSSSNALYVIPMLGLPACVAYFLYQINLDHDLVGKLGL